ncbi:class II fructose-bisphosphate aldolase [bacterium]|nr:class II fructose-bisphosphate aldolase [bacterium]
MPLTSIIPSLHKARAGAYAVPQFEIFEPSGCEDVIRALEEKRAPAMLGVFSKWFDKPHSHALHAAVRELGARAGVPVSLILDHGSSVEQCLRAIDAGYTDVMYDGSTLPFEENLEHTRRVVEAAHRAGVGVEAELGHVGSGADYQAYGAQRKGFTDPAHAAQFASETGVDVLAIAIGNAHGAYAGDPLLDCALLEEIARRIPIPLSLHGGSGLPEQQFRQAITRGIAKVNIATDLVRSIAEAMAGAAHTAQPSFFKMFDALHDTMHAKCCHYLDLFGTSGRA